MHEGQVDVAPELLVAAIAEQLPGLAGLPLRRIESAGTVIAPYRLGDELLVRLPLVPDAADAACGGLRAEADHARYLAGRLPVEVSRPVHLGEPFPGYPGVWSVWTWVEGTSLDRDPDVDRARLARDLAALLRAFHALPTGGRGWSGGGRGGRPLQDTAWVRGSIERCAHLVDAPSATAVWERALAAPAHDGPPVSIHGDPVPGNLVVRAGRLAGLIDLAAPCVGDPASDLAPAWTSFDEPERSVFREAMGLDDAAWERGRGWAFEMAVGALHYYEHTNPVFAAQAMRTIRRLL